MKFQFDFVHIYIIFNALIVLFMIWYGRKKHN